MEEYFEGWPLKLVTTETSNGGVDRYVVATRHIAAGETVFMARPFAVAIKLIRQTCALCLRFQSSSSAPCHLPYRCDVCEQAYYCSRQHQEVDRAAHQLECAPLRRIKDSGSFLTSSLQAELRMVLRIIRTQCLETFHTQEQNQVTEHTGEADMRKPQYSDVQLLCSHRESRSLEQVKTYRQALKALVGAREEDLPWSSHDLFSLLCQDTCNGFGIRSQGEDEGELFAYGLYPTASYFNHSCYPNICHIRQDLVIPSLSKESNDLAGGDGADQLIEPGLRFIAIRPINKGSLVCLTYIDPSRPTEARREALLCTYFFHCKCSRCEQRSTTRNNKRRNKHNHPSSASQYTVDRLLCRNCNTNGKRDRPGLLYPLLSANSLRCNLCNTISLRST